MKNRILKIGILSTAAVFALNQSCMAEIAFVLEDNKKHKIEISEPAQEITNNLFDSKEEMMKYYLENQKKMDVEDIKLLWESTVARNPVITFALQKLALSPEQRRISSSRMTKVIATLIRGAAMVPGMLGADPITSSASSFSGGLAGRYINENNMPKDMPITDTELIQLARLVEDLQDKIIKNYYDYKSNLEAYKIAKENAVKFNELYARALKTGDLPEIVTSGSMYNRAHISETEIKQKIKLNRLELERLAGVESVNKLNLGKIAILEELKKEASANNTEPSSKVMQGKVDYFDKDIRALAEEISREMQEEKQELLVDLQLLWSAAVENSETIRFAMMKLSNPDGEVEKKTAVKQILSPLASVAPIIGLGLSDPVTAGSTMFSGNLLNSALSDDSKINAQLSRVTDADLVLLAKETDSLQEKLIFLYHNYLSAVINLKLIDEIEKESKDYLDVVNKVKPGMDCVAQVFYNEIIDLKYQARQDVLSKRVALEQFVGNDALVVVDKNIQDRLSYKF